MEILLITVANKWMFLAIAGFLLLISVSFFGWCVISATPYEFENDPIDVPSEGQSVTYDDIMNCERPYVGNIYN